MTHHNAHGDEAEDYPGAFAELPAVLQSAALMVVRAGQALSDEQALATRKKLDALVQPGGGFDGAAAQFVTAAAMVLEAHYDEVRAENP